MYYQASDDTVRYPNGHRVPDAAAATAELQQRGMLRPDGSMRVLDYRAVMAELSAAAITAPALPTCSTCGGCGMRDGRDPLAGRDAPPPAWRCQACDGSGRARLSVRVGCVLVERLAGPVMSGAVETWHGVNPHNGDALVVERVDVADLSPRPGVDVATRPRWTAYLWAGWEDGRPAPRDAFREYGEDPAHATRDDAVAHLDAVCAARYGAAWSSGCSTCSTAPGTLDGPTSGQAGALVAASSHG